MLEERPNLFVKEPGVEPTNNATEQALRGAVIWRKKCFGNQSGAIGANGLSSVCYRFTPLPKGKI